MTKRKTFRVPAQAGTSNGWAEGCGSLPEVPAFAGERG